jgi:hypothetical protein
MFSLIKCWFYDIDKYNDRFVRTVKLFESRCCALRWAESANKPGLAFLKPACVYVAVVHVWSLRSMVRVIKGF